MQVVVTFLFFILKVSLLDFCQNQYKKVSLDCHFEHVLSMKCDKIFLIYFKQSENQVFSNVLSLNCVDSCNLFVYFSVILSTNMVYTLNHCFCIQM